MRAFPRGRARRPDEGEPTERSASEPDAAAPARRGGVPWEQRPLFGATLTMAGGVLVLLGGWALLAWNTPLDSVFALERLYGLGVVLGVALVVVGGVELLLPRTRRVLGLTALFLAAGSVPLAFGGFVVGFLLAVIGGTLAIVSRPVAGGRPSDPVVAEPAPPWS